MFWSRKKTVKQRIPKIYIETTPLPQDALGYNRYYRPERPNTPEWQRRAQENRLVVKDYTHE